MNILNMKITNIDLGTETTSIERIPPELVMQLMGGNGIAAKILYERIPPGIDPFTPENILFVGGGPLSGSGVYGSDRICFAAKSPLTGLFFDSSMGGRFSSSLKNTGYDFLAITGKARKLSYLAVSSEGIQIKDAGYLQGKSPEEVRHILAGQYANSEVAAIGIGGENLVRFASIIHPRTNGRSGVSGRGGLGAVMGSKNLKAVVVQRGEARKPEISLPSLLKEVMGRMQERLDAKLPHFKTIGTPSGVKNINNLGGYGTRNLKDEVFEFADRINGDVLRDRYYRKNIACFSCPLACGKLCEIDGRLVKNPEYETLYALGGMVGINDIEAIIRLNILCDELGLDTLSLGITLAFAIECFEKGLLTAGDTDQRVLRFGDSGLINDLIRATAEKKGFGSLLAEGTRRMSSIIGKDSWHYAHQVKGLELAGHSARVVKTLSIGYATNTRGGSHQDARVDYGPGMDTYGGKVEMAIHTQNMSSVGDSLIMCRFIMENGLGREFIEDYSLLMESVCGWKLTSQDFEMIGARIFSLERMFNVREGLTAKDDVLPYKVVTEEISSGPHKGFKTPPDKLQEMLQKYYVLRGWDNNGIPKPEILQSLGLK
jgi:aldehyde:ferredoxin oxidoreductase